MAATTLPLELIQSILLSTGPETYYTARQTCHSWRDAASSPYILRETLTKTPAPLPPSPLNRTTEQEWNNLFNQVARLNLLGRRDRITKNVHRRKRPSNWTHSTVIGLSGDGNRLVSLAGPRASIYNINEEREMELDMSRSLPCLWTLMNRAMTDDVMRGVTMGQHQTKYRITLSTTGSLVAIALCRTIQIYDLSMSSSPVEYILSDSEHLTSLAFVEDDTLLRVGSAKNLNRLDCESRVRYLGQPLSKWGSSSPSTGASLDYWRSNISFVYLDSAELAKAYRDDNKTSFQGLQLLPQSVCEDWTDIPGRFFVTAIQNTDADRYCVGFLPESDRTDIRIWKQLPSRADRVSEKWCPLFGESPLSSTTLSEDDGTGPASKSMFMSNDSTIVEQNRQMAHGRWTAVNMPELKTKRSILSISSDGKLLVVYERGAGHAPFAKGGALYIFSLESCRGRGRKPNISGDLGGVSSEQLQPWSFLLDIVDDDIDHVRVSDLDIRPDGRRRYKITAENLRDIMEWELA